MKGPRRSCYLYSPAVVVGLWVVVFNTIGRDDTTVTVGCIFLAISLAFFAYQIIEDFYRHNGQRHERHP
jgi:peptidoglycan/LPS O-acetylase OafA/YrhL